MSSHSRSHPDVWEILSWPDTDPILEGICQSGLPLRLSHFKAEFRQPLELNRYIPKTGEKDHGRFLNKYARKICRRLMDIGYLVEYRSRTVELTFTETHEPIQIGLTNYRQQLAKLHAEASNSVWPHHPGRAYSSTACDAYYYYPTDDLCRKYPFSGERIRRFGEPSIRSWLEHQKANVPTIPPCVDETVQFRKSIASRHSVSRWYLGLFYQLVEFKVDDLPLLYIAAGIGTATERALVSRFQADRLTDEFVQNYSVDPDNAELTRIFIF